MAVTQLAAALSRASKVAELDLDLSKEPLTEELGRLVNLKHLRLRGCPRQLRVPASIAGLEKLEWLSISGAGDEVILPEVLFELPILHLEASDCRLEQVVKFRRLQRLYVAVRDTRNDTAQLAEHLPELVHLELWGSDPKNGQLPPEIAAFQKLEVLDLVSCGLEALPRQLARLSRLHTLRLRGLPMTEFPEVITQLRRLRELQFQQRVKGLPDALAQLTSLQVLDLSHALNDGTTDAASDPPPEFLEPLPSVLGQLTGLQRLDLSACGVMSLEVIQPLTGLKALNLSFSGIEDLRQLGCFQALEELSLQSCYRVRDLGPLKSLPALRKLNLESCDLKSLAPLYELPRLAQLEADDELLRKWKRRPKARPSETAAESVTDRLASTQLPEIERALLELARKVEQDSTRDTSALWELFGLEPADDETQPVSLPALDAALERHARGLSTEALAAVVDATFRQMGDNFRATLRAVAELVRRRDVAGQLRVVQAYQRASRHDDAGHRAFEATVQDQLIERQFPKFEPEPLASLLERCSPDALRREGGDGLDALFAPAFKRATDSQTTARLATAFSRYFKKSSGHQGAEYFAARLQEFKKSAPPQLQQLLKAVSVAADASKGLERELRSDDKELVDRRFLQIGSELTDAAVERAAKAFREAFRRGGLGFEAVAQYLGFLVRSNERSALPREVVLALARMDLRRCEEQLALLATGSDAARDLLGEAARGSLLEAYLQQLPAKQLVALRRLVAKFSRTSADALLREQVKTLLGWSLDSTRKGRPTLDDGLSLLHGIEGRLKLPEGDADNLAMQVSSRAEEGRFEEVCQIAAWLPRLKLDPQILQRVLAQAIPSAMLSRNRKIEALCLEQVPRRVTSALLAYNLACSSAKRKDKPALLEYAKKASVLGKRRAQFLADPDFKPYRKDKDFLAAIGE